MTKDNSQTPTGLVRALGPAMATAVVVGTVIGSGVFYKPRQVSENVAYFGLVALVWVLGGVLAFFGGLSLAEVAVLYPKAGGNYVFLREAYGRMAGFLFGWVEFWVIRGASLAVLAHIFTESFHDILKDPTLQSRLGVVLGSEPLGFWQKQGLTVVVILALAAVNIRGVRWGGLLQLFITLVKVFSLLAIFALPFLVAAWADPASNVPRPDTTRLEPTWPDSWDKVALGGMATAFLGVLWAYHGWMNIAPIAEEVRHPQRNIPIAQLSGIGIVMLLYLGANLAYYLILPRQDIVNAGESAVATIFSARLLGPIGLVLTSAAIMCSVFGALNGNILVGPRLLYAMGEDGLAPRALGAVHPRYRTPALAIIVMAIWASILVIAGAAVVRSTGKVYEVGSLKIDLTKPKSLFDLLTDFAMFGSVIFETLAVLSIFVFRRTRADAPRPYRCPGYPIMPALYVLLPGVVLANFFVNQQLEAVTGTLIVGVGAVVYLLVFRGKRPKADLATSAVK